MIKVWERGHICLRNCLHIKHAVFTWLKYKFILGDWFHQLLTFYLSIYSYIYMHNNFLVGNCSIGFLALCLPPTPHLSWKCPFLCTPGYSKWGMAGTNFWGSRPPGNGSGVPWWEVGVYINPGFICRARQSTHGPSLQATCVGPHDPQEVYALIIAGIPVFLLPFRVFFIFMWFHLRGWAEGRGCHGRD